MQRVVVPSLTGNTKVLRPAQRRVIGQHKQEVSEENPSNGARSIRCRQ